MATKNKFLDLDQFIIVVHIGSGAFSKVYRVKNINNNRYYAAKVSKFFVDESTQDSRDTHLLFREVNLMSLLNHPTIIKFIGYSQLNFDNDSCPTIITEFASNGSLRDILNMENRGLSPTFWNDTKKLINIYGIALGMSYLHSNNIIHRDLKPENILLNDYLYPKISDFGLSKITDILSKSMNFQSGTGMKGTPIYMAPEIFGEEKYSKSSDVYAFAYIVYEILTNTIPFENFSIFQIMSKVGNEGYRPKINDDIPSAYKWLIEKCWSQKAEERPSFDEIVNELAESGAFITPLIDENEFFDYVEFNSQYKTTFDASKRLMHFEDFIKIHGKNKNIQKISITDFNQNDEIDQNEEDFFAFSITEFDELDENCQLLVNEAKKDPYKQFIVGQSLIEGLNGFPKNTKLGIQYINKSNSNNCLDSIFYYIQQLINGKNIEKDLDEAEKYLEKMIQSGDKRFYSLYGKLKKKKFLYREAKHYYEMGLSEGDNKCTYKLAKMLFLGAGVEINVKESLKYMKICQQQGYIKGDYFFKAMQIMTDINKSFTQLPVYTQYFFISNIINIFIENKNDDYNKNDKFEKLIIPISETEKLFFNRSFTSLNFHIFLEIFSNINIEIKFPSDSFASKADIIIKIKNKCNSNVTIGIVHFPEKPFIDRQFGLSEYFSYHRIDESNLEIPMDAFKNCTTLKKIIFPSSIGSIERYAFYNCSSLDEIPIPSSVKYIGNYAFFGCSKLKQITIPSFVEFIGNYTFSNCSMLEQIIIPSSVVTIGLGSFCKCKSLKEIDIPSTVTSIDNYAFNKCKSLKQISLPSLTTIKWGCFNGCKSLEKIEIPFSVTSIESHAFENCISLKKIVFPSSITSMGDYLLTGCSSLEMISIPPSVTSIGNYSFSKCSSLKHASIPPSVTVIGDYAFESCSSLEEISIPSSVNSIGNYSFARCSSLKEVIIFSSVTNIGKDVFIGCSSLKQVTLPSSIKKSKLGLRIGIKVKKI